MNRKVSAGVAAASIVSFAFLSLTLAAPRKKEAPDPAPPPPMTNEDVSAPAAGVKTILGTFVGPFGGHRITVCLQNLVGATVNGYSVVGGNERAFSGSLVDNDAAFELHAREPGDHPEDGRFVFTYRPGSDRLTGTWTPNNGRLQTVTFDLPRKNFRYDPKLGKYPQASTRKLKTAEVENVRPEDLRIMRNEMYARHGYTFRLKDMRTYFEQQDWYMPISMNVSAQLTPVEQKNEELIKRYENYGSEHYDAFGR